MRNVASDSKGEGCSSGTTPSQHVYWYINKYVRVFAQRLHSLADFRVEINLSVLKQARVYGISGEGYRQMSFILLWQRWQ